MHSRDSHNLFSGFASDYDRMINWGERLKRETPFYKKVFDEAQAVRVLDTACGTGRHAIMFESWGLSVEASDASEDMVATAKRNAEESGCKTSFRVAGLTELDKAFTPGFDVITCMGNSLPHLKEKGELNRSFSAASNLLRPKGLFVIQVRNYRRIYEKNEKFMPLNNRVEGQKEYLYLRMTELGEKLVTFNIMVLEKDESGHWSYRVESEELMPWKLEEIQTSLESNGFEVSGVYGGLRFEAFDPAESTDLVVVAKKTV